MQYHQHSICTITSAARTSTWAAKSSVFAGYTGARSETKRNGMNIVSSSQQALALPTSHSSIFFSKRLPVGFQLQRRTQRYLSPSVVSAVSYTVNSTCCNKPREHTPHPPTYPSGATSEWLPPYHVILKYHRPGAGSEAGSARHIGGQHSQSPILKKKIEALTVYLTITTW